mmetsp:Transcript_17321/g.41617  ORF Transcript_17321/g.41617 Transcript_17321/m.41617 type:complete len:135 (-) Transcript_17321:344-748(-)
MRSWTFEELLAMSMHSLRFYCQKDLFVTVRLIDMLADLGFICIQGKNGRIATPTGSSLASPDGFKKRLSIVRTHVNELTKDARSHYNNENSTERREIDRARDRARDLLRDEQSSSTIAHARVLSMSTRRVLSFA